MTREEILKQSRKAHTGMDEREQQVQAKSGYIAGRASIALGLILNYLIVLVDGPRIARYTIWLMVSCNWAITYGYQAFHLKKRSWWFYTVSIAAFGLFYFYLFLRETFIL